MPSRCRRRMSIPTQWYRWLAHRCDFVRECELAALVLDGERLLNSVHALSAVALEEFQRRGTWAADGALSAAGWAAARTGTPTRALRARLRAGAGLRLLPSAGRRLGPGGSAPRTWPPWPAAPAAIPTSPPGTKTVLVERGRGARRRRVRGRGPAVGGARRRRRRARPGRGAGARTGRRAAPVPHLRRPLPARRHLVRRVGRAGARRPRGARRPPAPRRPGRRPLASRRSPPRCGPPPSSTSWPRACAGSRRRRRCPTATGSPSSSTPTQPAEDLPLAACDSPAYRVVLGAAERGARRRAAHADLAGIRRAITLRDGVHLPRLRPAPVMVRHHCRTWSSGGSTSVDNGALLCRRHHTFIHKNTGRSPSNTANRQPETRRHVYAITRWTTARPGAACRQLAASA